uniref:Uncharacterized protein n=1 Tax=Arundo donax TaxID=35708 RepID=A0A0A9GY43_ARUDO
MAISISSKHTFCGTIDLLSVQEYMALWTIQGFQ